MHAHFRWETVNAVAYLMGGAIFVAGSVLFFPRFADEANIGAWAYFVGSLFYLIVCTHDLLEVIRYGSEDGRPQWDARLEFLSALSYLAGTVLFAVGSLFFLSIVAWTVEGAWLFIYGSGLFVLGACVNVLQIVRARSMVTLQLKNLTAISFIVGSVLFLVASLPYLWGENRAIAADPLHSFLAWQYLAGSCLFLLGGVFNYRRARVVVRQTMEAQSKAASG